MKALLFVLLLAGCTSAPVQPQHSKRYFQYTDSDFSLLNIRVAFASQERVRELCRDAINRPESRINACTLCEQHSNGARCTIHTPAIKDFNDERSLTILGHEVAHALGKLHE